jgi:hypothetical protein
LIAYSLGNFVTAMYTPHCRIGLILSLRLARDSQRRTDWHQPDVQWVYNARRNPLPGQRQLMLLENFLQNRDRLGRRTRKVGGMGDWLQRHLLGPPPNAPR